MKISKIKVNNFGVLSQKEWELSDKLTVFFGRNESGKSTIQSFIRAMLYGFGKGKGASERERYKPWNGGVYSGNINYTLDTGASFSVWRDFNSNQVNVFDERQNDISSSFDNKKENGLLFAQEHLGITQEIFDNSCYIPQMGVRIESKNENIVAEKIANLIETGNENTSFAEAKKILDKILVEEIGTDRTQGRPLNTVREKIKILESKKEAQIKMIDRIRGLEEEKTQLNTLIRGLVFDENQAKKILGLKKKENYAQKMQIHSENIDNLYAELANNETELIKINSVIPQGIAVFDSDVEEKLIEFDKEVKRFKAKKIIYGSGIGLLFFSIFLSYKHIIFKETFIGMFLVFSILSLGILLIKRKTIKEYEKEIIDILSTANAKDIGSFIERKKEIIFAIEKRNMIEYTIELIQGQIEIILKEAELKKRNPEIIREEADVDTSITDLQEESDQILDMTEIELEEYINKKVTAKHSSERSFSEIETEIRVLTEETEKIYEIEEALLYAKEHEATLLEKTESLKIALQVFEECSANLKDGMLPMLNEKLSKYSKEITGHYGNISTSLGKSEMRVTLSDGTPALINSLSGGTIDQIYLGFRLSTIEILSNKESLPIIMDEAFFQFDDFRLKEFVKMLDEITNKNQVILFTCKEHEVKKITETIPNARIINL